MAEESAGVSKTGVFSLDVTTNRMIASMPSARKIPAQISSFIFNTTIFVFPLMTNSPNDLYIIRRIEGKYSIKRGKGD